MVRGAHTHTEPHHRTRSVDARVQPGRLHPTLRHMCEVYVSVVKKEADAGCHTRCSTRTCARVIRSSLTAFGSPRTRFDVAVPASRTIAACPSA